MNRSQQDLMQCKQISLLLINIHNIFIMNKNKGE